MDSGPHPNEIKQQVRRFYDQIGWQVAGGGVYQNARYEDLRPVSREYIHRCHLRVGRWLKPAGKYLLDAGSGPVQYAEYLSYSQGYRYRVCADISAVALLEARRRIGEHGLFVVADAARLPFKTGAFAGAVSLHTFHHLPAGDHAAAYDELYRVMQTGSTAVVVNGWTVSPLMRRLNWMVTLMETLASWTNRLRGKKPSTADAQEAPAAARESRPSGTFVEKIDAGWLERTLAGRMEYEVRVWRSVSVRFLRAVIKPYLGGRIALRLLYRLEERFPHWFGVNGQYPLIVVRKP